MKSRKTKQNPVDGLMEVRRRLGRGGPRGIEVGEAIATLGILFGAVDSTVGGLALTRRDGRIAYVNPSFLRIFRYPSREAVLGFKLTRLFSPGPEGDLPDLGELVKKTAEQPQEHDLRRQDGSLFPALVIVSSIMGAGGRVIGRTASFVDITRRRQLEAEKDRLIVELRETLANVRTLKGLIPICASCKKIRDDAGFWHQVEVYVRDHTAAQFTHGICPDCKKRLYPELSGKE